MKLDSLVRVIEAADFMAFRELALECLSIKGYRDVALTDGWSDGGTDVRVFQLPPNPTPIAFQISVEWEWKTKLRKDAAKIKNKLALVHMTLVTSRRIPEAEFQTEAEGIWQTLGVRATKLDSQSIASTFFLEGRTTRVLDILGIQVTPERVIADKEDARSNAAYSFVFFGKETHRFRDATVESAIISIGARHVEPIERSDFEREVCEVLQLQGPHTPRVAAAVDRMIQRGDLSGPDPAISLSPQLADAARAMRSLRDSEWHDLREAVDSFIRERGAIKKVPETSLDAIMTDLGAVLLESAHSAVASLESLDTRSVLADHIRKRLRHLHSTLDSLGFAEGTKRDTALEDLAELASNSPIGKCILSGELFLSLRARRMPQLIRALGARSGVKVLLDSSVAIPMLCGLLFKPVGNRFSVAAQHSYSQLQAHGLSMVLPLDYLEESATHLLRAYADYQHIIDLDPDLVSSENAFVSHYASLRQDGKASSFSDYLTAFGLDHALRRAEFYVARDNLMPRLERLFDRYSIAVQALGRVSSTSQRKAEESMAHAIHELKVERPKVLVRHDLRTIGYLHDTDRSGELAHVLCTWDGVHFWVRERENADWQVLNPAALGDIIALAATEDLRGHIASPTVLAKSLSEEAAQRGAEVWDRLVRIERGRMHDAELLAQARAFKEDYIGRLQSGKATRNVKRAWAEWKSKHYTQESSEESAD